MVLDRVNMDIVTVIDSKSRIANSVFTESCGNGYRL